MNEKTENHTPVGDAEKELESLILIEDTMDKFIATADVEKVYGKPIKSGDTLIVPTAEILCAMGFGGVSGGRVLSRPVAVVIASPEGVRVEPVFDPTKIALAAITAAGFILSMLFRMMRGPRRLS